MKILVLGSSSFAAAEIVGRLREKGHEVWTFDRRKPKAKSAYGLAGDAARVADICSDAGPFEVLVNYLLLKNSTVAQNLEYCRQLAIMAERQATRRLVHISSVIVAASGSCVIDEESPIEHNIRHRPPYSCLKIATELELRSCFRTREVVIVRPGFILGPGLADPMPGIGRALGAGQILGMGNRNSVIPLVERDKLDRSVVNLVKMPLPAREIVVQLVDSRSPRREEYLSFCCRCLGLGRRVWFLPPWFWRGALLLASPLLALRTRKWKNLARTFAHNLSERRYDSQKSEQLLGDSCSASWKDVLTEACESQKINFENPRGALTLISTAKIDRILLVGGGRIVRERHLVALKRMEYTGVIEWYDPYIDDLRAPNGLKLRRLRDLSASTSKRAIVATPAASRVEIARCLPRTIESVLWEKPYATSTEAFNALSPLTAHRTDYVIHNYRYKWNIQSLKDELERWNPGELKYTRLHFDSPSIECEQAAWLKDEWSARTLVMDYGIHFIDLALLFASGSVAWREIRSVKGARGMTAAIHAFGSCRNQACSIFLRQGARQRRCEIEYIFQNYGFRIRFFPESAVALVGGSSFVSDITAAAIETVAFGRKALEKVHAIAPEPSHQIILEAFLGGRPIDNIGQLKLENISRCYESILKLADTVYGSACDI